MNGYSKIVTRKSETHKSRSMDFSDFFSFPQTPKPSRNTAPKMKGEEEANRTKNNKIQNSSFSTPPEREDIKEVVNNNNGGERFGVILGRSISVSSSASSSASYSSGIVKRAFSMRRSSSVNSERYCRIHDQYMALASPIRDDEIEEGTVEIIRSAKNKHRGRKIFKACKRLFGL